MEKVLPNLTIEQSQGFTDTDKYLLANLNSQQLDVDKIRDITTTLINKLIKTRQANHDQITAVMVRFLYEDCLRPNQLEALDQLFFRAMDESVDVADLFKAMKTIDQEVENYFNNPRQQEKMISTNPLQDPLACTLLNIKCYLKTQQIQEGFGKTDNGYIAEAFRNPQTSMWGIWLSVYGKHFDPDLLNRV